MPNLNLNSTSLSAEVQRPTYAKVNLKNIESNYLNIKKHVGSSIVMPVLKANAYGHGILPVAIHLEKIGTPYFGVSFLEEGLLLREAGIKTPILVFGGINYEQISFFIDHDLTITASSIEKLEKVEEMAKAKNKKAIVHLKIDTGMERIGIHHYNARSLIMKASEMENCTIEGIYSHFSKSESQDLSRTKKQLEYFLNVLEIYSKEGLELPKLKHISNSGSILQMPEANFDLVRPGILMYGEAPTRELRDIIELKRAITLKTKVVFFKVVKAGNPISYGSTWQSDHDVRVVTIPIGYGDGYLRGMSNKAEVIIRDKKYPVVGRICMDQCMINIESDEAYNSEDVILLGETETQKISHFDLADWASTDPREIMTSFNSRIPRIYVKE